MIDALEPILQQQLVPEWSRVVVYVTDTTPEFNQGKTDRKLHVSIMPKDKAIAWEMSFDSEAGRMLAARFRESQEKVNTTWIVASTAENEILATECVVYQFRGEPASA